MQTKSAQPLRRKAKATIIAALAAAWMLPMPVMAQDAPKKVVLRFASDFPAPPHPAALAMKYFGERLPQVIPGSEARLYYAGALYTVPEAFEAMRQGNLEMTWMQIGKAAPVDPWMLSVVGPGILTTVGAVDSLEQTETYQMLVDRLSKNQLVKVFGVGHMSFGMGVGGKKQRSSPFTATPSASAARSATRNRMTSRAPRCAAWAPRRTRCSPPGRRTRW